MQQSQHILEQIYNKFLGLFLSEIALMMYLVASEILPTSEVYIVVY